MRNVTNNGMAVFVSAAGRHRTALPLLSGSAALDCH